MVWSEGSEQQLPFSAYFGRLSQKESRGNLLQVQVEAENVMSTRFNALTQPAKGFQSCKECQHQTSMASSACHIVRYQLKSLE